MKGNVLITECTQQLKMYRDNSWSILFNLYPLTHFPPLEIIFEVNPRHITLCTSAAAAAAAKSLQSCQTLCDPIDGSSPGSPIPGVFQARVGCHILLQCMKVKGESEVAQSCPTPSDPMDCSPPGSSVHGTFQARVLEWGAIAFSEKN